MAQGKDQGGFAQSMGTNTALQKLDVLASRFFKYRKGGQEQKAQEHEGHTLSEYTTIWDRTSKQMGICSIVQFWEFCCCFSTSCSFAWLLLLIHVLFASLWFIERWAIFGFDKTRQHREEKRTKLAALCHILRNGGYIYNIICMTAALCAIISCILHLSITWGLFVLLSPLSCVNGNGHEWISTVCLSYVGLKHRTWNEFHQTSNCVYVLCVFGNLPIRVSSTVTEMSATVQACFVPCITCRLRDRKRAVDHIHRPPQTLSVLITV